MMMKPFQPLIAFVALALLAACSHGQTGGSSPASGDSPQASKDDKGDATALTVLTEDAAKIRAKQLGNVSYHLWFGLDSTHDEFEGRALIDFGLREKAKELNKELLIDFEGGTITGLTLNEVLIPSSQIKDYFDGHHIRLKVSNLIPAGNNRIKIAYTHPYSNNGEGLHRFKDPVDGLVYLYSQFEPYDAHKMFPCFDQPDLKASFELTVDAPASWEVVSNTAERDTSPVDGRKSWAFPPTPQMSTYVFALIAGPYKKWTGDADGVPLRLMARKSLQAYIDHEEWLEVTRRGLDFYQEFFGYPYPFAKYDQVIVPDFNAGAMENAGAVTFSERYVYRSKETMDRHRDRANTILHEMAHMWFGDLVTMKWWNGLWLNESFATFMASWAVDRSTDFKGAWQAFFSTKGWGYWEDELVTTHAIEGAVPTTRHAETIFDGITYGKGASVLKQLSFWLGEKNFRKGLQNYFSTYAFGNTTLADFIGSLGQASGEDLSVWQKKWLESPSLNTVEASWTCDAGKKKIVEFMLKQDGSSANPELRPHRTRIGLYYPQGGGKLKASKVLDINYTEARTPVPAAVGKPCPEMVYPNEDDYDYAKAVLDPISLKTARTRLKDLDSSFTRELVWFSLWQMVIDAKLPAQEYIDIAVVSLKSETNTLVLRSVLNHLASSSSVEQSAIRLVSPELAPDQSLKLEKFYRQGMAAAPGGSDQQLLWFRAYVRGAVTKEALNWMSDALDGKASALALLKGMKVDQERRWELIQGVSRLGAADALTRIAAELKKDMTDMGQKQAIAAEAIFPSKESKLKWLARVSRTATDAEAQALKVAQLRGAMSNFYGMGQEELTRLAVDPYFQELTRLASSGKTEDEDYAPRFASLMYPGFCDSRVVQRTAQLVKEHPEFPATVVKHLRVNQQEEERCIRARQRSHDAVNETGFAKLAL